MMRLRRTTLTLALLASVPVSLLGAGEARAYLRSANWSGYVAHRAGLRFGQVHATWTQPVASCVPGQRTYAALWVGLGGYQHGLHELEQVGTEVDCTATGGQRDGVWYELVPAPTRSVPLSVNPGDTITATVSVSGHTVNVSLADLTSRQSFHRTLGAAHVDISSADWIVEAPAACVGNKCQVLPLANFGSVTFTRASARTTSGHTGPINDPSWFASRIMLRPHRTQLAAGAGTGRFGIASTSALRSGGSSFRVTFSQLAVRAAAQAARAVSIFH
jgi:hypothetical protein